MIAKTAALGLAGLLALGSASVQAGSINAREQRQKDRIRHGVTTGELNRRETGRLLAEQARIRREEYRFRHDNGHLGPWERIQLQRDLNQSSRHIYRQAHDGQDR